MELEEIAKTLKRIEDDIHTIKRGVYGDEANGVKGLIETDREQHQRIKKLEEVKSKAVWVVAGGAGVFELLHWLFGK